MTKIPSSPQKSRNNNKKKNINRAFMKMKCLLTFSKCQTPYSVRNNNYNRDLGWALRLTPVILSVWEAETRKIMDPA
jgi:hypothetical protein